MAPRYTWVVKAYSPSDAGWVRILWNFKTEELAWEGVQRFWEVFVLAGGLREITVIKTIRF